MKDNTNGPGWELCECGHDIGWHHGVYGCCWHAEGDEDSWPGTDQCRRWRPVPCKHGRKKFCEDCFDEAINLPFSKSWWKRIFS